MFLKTCEGCGQRFQAQKLSRKWCSDVCGRRARRQNARALGGSALGGSRPRRPVIPLAVPDDPYVRLNVEFAAALGTSLPADLLAALADDDDDYSGDVTEDEFAAVALRITDTLGVLARSLQALMGDLVDTRVVSYLAQARS